MLQLHDSYMYYKCKTKGVVGIVVPLRKARVVGIITYKGLFNLSSKSTVLHPLEQGMGELRQLDKHNLYRYCFAPTKFMWQNQNIENHIASICHLALID